MNKALLLSCFLILFSLACVGPTGFLIDESQKSTLKDIDKLFLVIELELSYESMAGKADYKRLDLNYVRSYAKNILENSSGLEIVHSDNKKTDKSFVLIKIESRPYCDHFNFAGFRCPVGEVSGELSLYLNENKIFYNWFSHYERIEKRYYGFPPNAGEEYAFNSSQGFKNILHKIGSEIHKYSPE